MTIKKIQGHEYAQVKVYKYEDGSEALISYTTTVITVDADGWMTVNGLYSRTTIKHIGWYMRAMGLDYYTAKQLYLDNVMMNLITGEIKERA